MGSHFVKMFTCCCYWELRPTLHKEGSPKLNSNQAILLGAAAEISPQDLTLVVKALMSRGVMRV